MPAPIHIISLGAGVQSSTMALMAAHGEITPMPKCAIFADTQDETEEVYLWLNWLCGVPVKYRVSDGVKEAYVEAGEYRNDILPYPVQIVTAGKLSEKASRNYFSERNQKLTVSGIPAFSKTGMFPRQCTSDFKVIPIDREITKQMKALGVKRTLKWIGISLDEIHRMKPSRRPTVDHIWPLINARVSRNDCENWMKARGYRKPPRSACRYCPYHSDSEWRRIRNMPTEFALVVKFEKELQLAYSNVPSIKAVPFLHRSCVPINQVDFSTDEDHGQQIMFGNECEGLCGV